MRFLTILLVSVLVFALMPKLSSQTNMRFSNGNILPVLKGDYDPADYMPSQVIDDPALISERLNQDIDADSLKNLLISLSSFRNRNTGSDTLSATEGIGAARTWILEKFDAYDAVNEDRLITGYFQFDQVVCGMGHHKNVVAVLPGRDNTDPSFIIIEGHMDSRCADGCDIDCRAEGMEDNGSGTALVMELARVMSQFVFDHTLIFMATTGEEQGLVGANAFAEYAIQQDLAIKAVLNNDVIGGIVCGETSSPPSCPGLNHIDSTQVRLFSFGGARSFHKGLCRFIKLEYQEMLLPFAGVPMQITIMSAEDRTGRGGDHIPFRENGFTAMRFTSANEHGSADVSDPDYHDRQHTADDILGIDTDGDEVLDSFFVNFNYLARNTAINGNAAAMAAAGPQTPEIKSASQDGDIFFIEIDDPNNYDHYVIGLRTDFHDFDTLYYLKDAKSGFFTLAERDLHILLSVAAIDSNGVESLFSEELIVTLSGVDDPGKDMPAVQLMQNRPNPFDEATIIAFMADARIDYREACIAVTDLEGREIKRMDIDIREGLNEVLYRHGYNMTGTFLYSLVIDGEIVETRRMVFAN